MGSSMGPTTTTSQQKDPWGPSQGYLQDIMGQSQQLYNQGAGSQVWNGPTQAPLDPNTQGALNYTAQTANANMGNASQPFQAALNGMQNNGMTPGMSGPMGVLGSMTRPNGINTGDQYSGLMQRAQGNNADAIGGLGGIGNGQGSPGTSDMQNLYGRSQGQNNDSLGTLGGVANGQNGITTGGQYQGVANQAGGPSAASSYLTDMAKGGGVNPALQAMMDDQAARISNRVASSMSGAGRYGSVDMGDAMARSIGAANNPLLAQAYEGDQNRRLGATSQMDAARLGGMGMQLNALSGLTGTQNQNIGNQMGAANSAANIRQGDTQLGAGLLGQIANTQQLGVNNRMNAYNSMGGLRNQNMQMESNALNGLSGVQGQNIANQMGAAQGMLGQMNANRAGAQNWAQMAPMLNNLQYDPGQRLAGAGAIGDARAQSQLDSQRQLFEQQQQMPWQQLGRYQNGISGLGGILQGMGTTSGTQQQNPGAFNYMQMFGGGANSPVSGMANAASSALPLLAMLSDRNEKTDIKKLGTSDATGLDIYAYRYKGDPKNYPKMIGPMAQDIEQKYPGATGLIDGKMYVKPHATGLLGI